MPTQHDREPVTDDLLAGLGAELTRLSRRRSVPPGSRLDRSAFWVLWAVSEADAVSLKDIAEVLDLDQSTVSRQVAAAVRHGWVTRVEATPGVPHAVSVTTEGAGAFEHDRQLRGLRYRAAAEGVGPQALLRLTQDLRAFNDAMDGASEPDRS